MSSRQIHLVGIGGIGLSAIARILVARGDRVTGSDIHPSAITEQLEKLGVRVEIGHRAENVGNADLVLVTSAAAADNPEVLYAQSRGIRVVKRIDFFPELTRGYKTIAVAGTHGKTTTTGMIASLFTEAGLDPTAVIGGMIPEFGGNARAGEGPYFVIEADEYERAFLGLQPHIAVVTSIEMDHPDIFSNVEEVGQAFQDFCDRVSPDGLVVACSDSDRVSRALRSRAPVVHYGLHPGNNWWATNIQTNSSGGSDFLAWHDGARDAYYSLQIPGKHNVLNALATIIVGKHVGIESSVMRHALSHFRGAERRFQVLGDFHGVTVVDDYAHHPTEIRATLAAGRCRYPGRVLWAVFQPHTFSRTRALLDEFANAFGDADHVIVTEIYGARESESLGTSGTEILERMRHEDARFIAGLDETADYLSKRLQSGEVLITLGAGDVNRVGEQVASRLEVKSHV